MNSDILTRYDMTTDNRFIIEVNVPDQTELFEKYDSNASFYKKDINVRFEDYLLECVEEIGYKNKFIIRIDMPEDQFEKVDEGDVMFSFKQYFNYGIEACYKEIKTSYSRMGFHLIFALLALILMVVLPMFSSGSAPAFLNEMTTGLSAAIWVLLLTGLSRLVFRIRTQRSEIKLYEALKNAPIEFNFNGK